jgi:hypothetical protein
MSDIVARLRGRAASYRQLWGNAAYYTEGDALLDEKTADTITRLTAEVERLTAVALDAEKESKYSYFEAHIDRIGDENRAIRAEVERKTHALKLAHKYVLVQSFDPSLMPRDAKIDLAVIEDALATKEKQND